MSLLPEFIAVGLLLASGVITLWMAGAIYFDLCQAGRWARWLVAAWFAGVVALFMVWQPLWQPFLVLLGIAGLFLIWWFRQKPSHDHDWDPTVAVLPRAMRDGDLITLENVRNFEYRSLDDFTPRYETRRVHLANLRALDIIFFKWSRTWMGHPMLVFDFGAEGRICISIEVRLHKGRRYSLLHGLYRQQELIFLVCDERDAILRRTKHGRNQVAYLYRFQAGAEELQTTFLDYVEAIESLCETPRWYHVLGTNCVTSFYQLRNSRVRYDWRVIANGRLDEALYKDGRLDRSLPFVELRRNACINEIANSAPDADFGDHIRRELERRRQGYGKVKE